MHGKIVVIEGGDGCGKATQTKLLVEKLKQAGYPVQTKDFPAYQTFYGKIIRRFLAGEFGNPREADPFLASTLFAMNRFECNEELWRWVLEGQVVVLDRYLTSNFIYQGCVFETDEEKFRFIEKLKKLEIEQLQLPAPQLVIYLHVHAEVAQMLINQRGREKDLNESDFDYVKRVEQMGLWLAAEFGWPIIECCPDKESILGPEEIHRLLWEKISMLA